MLNIGTRTRAALQNARTHQRLVLTVAVWATLPVVAPTTAYAQDFLGSAASFAVLGGSAVNNTGSSIIQGNLGVNPSTAVTGFPPGIVTGGTIYAQGAVAAQAQSDVTIAYDALANIIGGLSVKDDELGGLTLTPGVYKFSSAAQLTGSLVLDALGDTNARFVFQIGTALNTANNSTVQIINGGNSNNVYWQVGSSATLGTSSQFKGSILALTSITATTGANIESGRLLARTGAVTLDTNRVIAPTSNVGISAAAPEPHSLVLLLTGGLPLMGYAVRCRTRRRK